MRDLSRRDFMLVTAAALEVAMLGWPLSTLGAMGLDLSKLPSDIGERYLSFFPSERDVAVLKDLLRYNDGLSSQGLRQRLKRDIQADYELNQVFRFNGWVFSFTEGRLCGLKLLGG